MFHDTRLASRFGRGAPVLQSSTPLSDDQLQRVAPSIFASEPHGSRSERYTYIPTIDVLNGLRREGFEPFMCAQTRVRNQDRREFTKHMLRLRHANQIAGREVPEIILLNSHDGTSSYQMIAGMFRFVCTNGMVCGDTVADYRVPHKGNVVDQVIEGAFQVLDGFEAVTEQRDSFARLQLSDAGQRAFARAALAVRYDEPEAAPIEPEQLLRARRFEDRNSDLWSTFNRVQENMVRGGLRGRNANGGRMSTREIGSINENVKVNRALWILAEEMRKLAA